ncbi:unnamed protein product [Dovyalis caffra]|uniref:Uncharacterized protein n=1 Tax=Dovyalis caffra TaxID=77055 RepID=A0AAV1QQ03_9ROSI|nr:unnamed protein product [Dovyalis caffra]
MRLPKDGAAGGWHKLRDQADSFCSAENAFQCLQPLLAQEVSTESIFYQSMADITRTHH